LKKVITFLFFILITITAQNMFAEKESGKGLKIAIINFSANPKPGDDMAKILEIQTITDLVTDEVKKSLKLDYEITIQYQLKNTLKKNDLPQAGIISNMDALISTAKALSVKNVIMGSVEMEEGYYFIKMKILNTENNRDLDLSYKMKDISEIEDEKFRKDLRSSVESLNRTEKKEITGKEKEGEIKKEKKGEDAEKAAPEKVEPVKKYSEPETVTVRPYKWYAVGSAATGLVLVTTALIYGSKSSDEKDLYYSIINSDNKDSNWETDAENHRNNHNSYDNISTASYVAGGVFIAAGAALYFITDKQPKNYSFNFGAGKESFMLNFSLKF